MTQVCERLRELDMFPQGFPKTASGVEIGVLKNLLTPPEAEIMPELRPYPETVASISACGKRDPDDCGRIL